MARPESIDDGRSGLLLLGFVLLAATMARLMLLDLGPTADEVANVDPRGLWAIWADPETGVNPPLFRWLMNLAPAGQEVSLGRWLSMAAGLAGLTLAVTAARRLQAPLAALTALLAAQHYHLLIHSVEARSYGLLGAVLLAQAFAAEAALRDDRLRRWAPLVLLVAAGLWLHYLAWPITAGLVLALAFTAPWRRTLLVAGGAALAAAPLVPRLLAPSPLRHLPDESWAMVLGKLLRFDLTTPAWLLAPILRPLPRAATEYVPNLLGVALVVGLLGGRLIGWRRRAPLERLLLLQWLGLILGATAIATFQNVRPPVVGLSLLLALPPLTAALSPPGRPLLSAALLVPLCGWLTLGNADLMGHAPWTPPYRAWSDALDHELAAAPPEQVRVRPGWLTPLYAYTLTGRPLTGQQDRDGCPDGTACFMWRGVRVIGDDGSGDGWLLVDDPALLGPEEAACPEGPPPLGARLRLCPPKNITPPVRGDAPTSNQ